MAKTAFKTVPDYIASQPKPAQKVLRRVRSIIRKCAPTAIEQISYGIPTYKLDGRPVIYFAGWHHHFSLYPSNARLVAAFRGELEPYKISKGTIRFPLSEPVPFRLIEALVRHRAKEVAG